MTTSPGLKDRPSRPSRVRDVLERNFREMCGEVGQRDAVLHAVEAMIQVLTATDAARALKGMTPQIAAAGICGAALAISDRIEASTLTVDKLKRAFEDVLGAGSGRYFDPAVRPDRPAWWTVLGLEKSATPDAIRAAYRSKAPTAHPDTGGSAEAMAELNAARDDGLRARTP